MTAVIPRAISFVRIAGPSEIRRLIKSQLIQRIQFLPGQTLRSERRTMWNVAQAIP